MRTTTYIVQGTTDPGRRLWSDLAEADHPASARELEVHCRLAVPAGMALQVIERTQDRVGRSDRVLDPLPRPAPEKAAKLPKVAKRRRRERPVRPWRSLVDLVLGRLDKRNDAADRRRWARIVAGIGPLSE